jgi:hypothetical protein
MTGRDLERELAAELHALLLEFKTTVPDDAALRDAIDHVRAARDGLGGIARPRWFEALRDDVRSGTHTLNFNEHSLFRGLANPMAPGVAVDVTTMPDGTPAVVARLTCSELYEGPPHGVHGGYVAGLFDDVLGSTMRFVEGPSGVTGTLSVKYRKLTPLDTELTFLGWVHHVSGRRIQSKATCHAGGVLTAEAEALFIRVDMQALADRQADYSPR